MPPRFFVFSAKSVDLTGSAGQSPAMLKRLIPLALFTLSAPALADPPSATVATTTTLQRQVEATLATAPQGTRFGLLVIDETGKVVVAVNPDSIVLAPTHRSLREQYSTGKFRANCSGTGSYLLALLRQALAISCRYRERAAA